DVGGVLEDRRLARAGHRLRLRAGVDHARLEAVGAVAALGGLAHQSCTRRRLEEMMPELKPPQESSAWRRPNSIFGQRSMTTVSPAARARSAAASLTTPSCIQTTLIPFSLASVIASSVTGPAAFELRKMSTMSKGPGMSPSEA